MALNGALMRPRRTAGARGPASEGSGDASGALHTWRPPVPKADAHRLRLKPCCAFISSSSGSTSDPAMEEALYDKAPFREFVGLDAG